VKHRCEDEELTPYFRQDFGFLIADFGFKKETNLSALSNSEQSW
jgi:hypothetical protein